MYSENITEPTLRLFNAVCIGPNSGVRASINDIHKLTIPHGFMLDIKSGSDRPIGTDSMMSAIDDVIGYMSVAGEKLNNTFRGSWSEVAELGMVELRISQCIHYVTEHLKKEGYPIDSYIPLRDMEIPGIDFSKSEIKIIKCYTPEEVKSLLEKLCSSGIALSEQTVKDVVDITYSIGRRDFSKIKNKEVSMRIMDLVGDVPTDASTLMRYICYKATGSALLIKDKSTISSIKNYDNLDQINDMLSAFIAEQGVQCLAEVFNRYKPIFLAIKNPNNASIINRIGKLSKTLHKPMKRDLPENIGSLKPEEFSDFVDALNKATIFRKIRIYNYIVALMNDSENRVYRIRNGKSYAVKKDADPQGKYMRPLSLVIQMLAREFKGIVGDRKVFIPEDILYKAPTSEKSFIGNIPFGTGVRYDEDIVVGIHRVNSGGATDIDLSLVGIGEKIGWNSEHRSTDKSILFSGDIVNAPDPTGATELFYIKQDAKGEYLMWSNIYNGEGNAEYKVILGTAKQDEFKSNYMINPNNVIMTCDHSNNGSRQASLGIINCEDKIFYLCGMGGGNAAISGGEYGDIHREYLKNQVHSSLKIEDLFVMTGMELADSPKEADIDLSLDKISKDSIISLFTKTEE